MLSLLPTAVWLPVVTKVAVSPFTNPSIVPCALSAVPSYVFVFDGVTIFNVAGVIVSLPLIALATIYFLVTSTVPTVSSANAASYSPASVPLTPTVIVPKSAAVSEDVNPLADCFLPVYVTVLPFAVSVTFL